MFTKDGSGIFIFSSDINNRNNNSSVIIDNCVISNNSSIISLSSGIYMLPPAKIYDWFDDATKGRVDYTPWAEAVRTDAP